MTSANEPFKVKVTNTSSSLSGELANAFNIDAAPAFGVAAGLWELYQVVVTVESYNSYRYDDEGDSITFSITSGSLPME